MLSHLGGIVFGTIFVMQRTAFRRDIQTRVVIQEISRLIDLEELKVRSYLIFVSN